MIWTLSEFKKKKTWFVFLISREEKKYRIHSTIMFPFSPVSAAEPAALMYLYRNLLIAKICMVDGRLHELCLSNCGSTITQLHHVK